MELHNNIYVPVLRWKEAERIAFSQLSSDIRRRVAPIVEFVPKEFDPTALRTSSVNANRFPFCSVTKPQRKLFHPSAKMRKRTALMQAW